MKRFISIGIFVLATSLFADNAEIIKVTSSGHDKDYIAENSIDGNTKTRWANNKESSLLYEFKVPTEISEISIYPFKGEERKQRFSMEVSMDGKNWTKVLNEVSTSGTKKGYEDFKFKQIKVKFVKLNMLGTDINKWSGIHDIKFQ